MKKKKKRRREEEEKETNNERGGREGRHTSVVALYPIAIPLRVC